MPEEFLDLTGLPHWREAEQQARQLRRWQVLCGISIPLAIVGWATVLALVLVM